MIRSAAAALLLAVIAAVAAAGEQSATYRVSGTDARLFDQYDNDGYSLAVTPAADGSLELKVRVSRRAPWRAALRSHGPPARKRPSSGRRPGRVRRWPRRREHDAGGSRPPGPRRDRPRGRLRSGQAAPAGPRRRLRSRRAYCVGFAELAVDLLARAGSPARTVQGIPADGAGRRPLRGRDRRHLPPLDRGLVSRPRLRLLRSARVHQRRRRAYLPFDRRSLRRAGVSVRREVTTVSEGSLATATVRAARRPSASGRPPGKRTAYRWLTLTADS